ncbi:MAG TPA: response regulator transcription factor [Ramlibacter sp.]|nr:response regulator transcription factor [Ramlibacter sp.]
MPATTVPIRVFLADHSGIIRERVAAMLVARGMSVVGHGDTPRECIDEILATRPDVVVLEVELDGGSGLQVLRAVRLLEPGIACLVFTIHADPAFCLRYLAEGARRFLDKATEFDQLASAIEQAFAWTQEQPDTDRSGAH